MRESTVFGIEKPFPWALIGAATLAAVGFTAGCGAIVVALGLGSKRVK